MFIFWFLMVDKSGNGHLISSVFIQSQHKTENVQMYRSYPSLLFCYKDSFLDKIFRTHFLQYNFPWTVNSLSSLGWFVTLPDDSIAQKRHFPGFGEWKSSWKANYGEKFSIRFQIFQWKLQLTGFCFISSVGQILLFSLTSLSIFLSE